MWTWRLVFLTTVMLFCQKKFGMDNIVNYSVAWWFLKDLGILSISIRANINISILNISFNNFLHPYQPFFSIWVFFHEHSGITGLQGKGEFISLTPHYHFHPLHGHLDMSRAITAESSPLHVGSDRTRTGNLWFPSASR